MEDRITKMTAKQYSELLSRFSEIKTDINLQLTALKSDFGDQLTSMKLDMNRQLNDINSKLVEIEKENKTSSERIVRVETEFDSIKSRIESHESMDKEYGKDLAKRISEIEKTSNRRIDDIEKTINTDKVSNIKVSTKTETKTQFMYGIFVAVITAILVGGVMYFVNGAK